MATEVLETYLLDNYINQVEYDTAKKILAISHHSAEDILLACGFVTSRDIALRKAKKLNLQFVDLTQYAPTEEALCLIPRDKALDFSILPFRIVNNQLIIAIDDSTDYKYQAYLSETSQMDIKFVIAAKSEIINHLMNDPYYINDDVTLARINEMKLHSKDKVNIINLVDLLIDDAIEDSVSDIHISPEKNVLNVFYRLDGVLVHYHSLPVEFHQMIVSRIKIMSNLDISQTSLPQDGQLEYTYRDSTYRLRVSSLTTSFGENIVMRVLQNNVANLSVDNLGLSEKNTNLLTQLCQQPNGLILVTGPTGSGKTTTLYSALEEIDSLSKNILTVEDPVEYQLPFVKQTQINVKAGYTFNAAIRAFMRQDPDVILVGEIRDQETAELALRASITGHLVFSTLHTNDAVGSIARLADLGIPRYLIGSSISAIISQRLIRKLCSHCKRKVQDSGELLKKWEVPQALISNHETISLYEAQGCAKCSQTGYKSREVILEILRIDKTIEDMIVHAKSSLEILNYAKTQKMETILEDAYSKVLQGITTFEEVQRMVSSLK